MGSDPAQHHIVLLTSIWDSLTELSFVTRAVAGKASRSGPTSVVVPGDPGSTVPDGAFDLLGCGQGVNRSWPDPTEVRWPALPLDRSTVVVDHLDDSLRPLLDMMAVRRPVFSISRQSEPLAFPDLIELRFVALAGPDTAPDLRIAVPINPLAAEHRHNGLGFTDYILVLTDRVQAGSPIPPPDAVAWITAGFPKANVVLVEDATAAVWRGRALRGVVNVDTRTDLWRLIAHARVTVDLCPGTLIGRECIESLRFGTPIIVPAQSVAASHAQAGGGLSFHDTQGLLGSLDSVLGDNALHARLSAQGRDYADAQFGDGISVNRDFDHLVRMVEAG